MFINNFFLYRTEIFNLIVVSLSFSFCVWEMEWQVKLIECTFCCFISEIIFVSLCFTDIVSFILKSYLLFIKKYF
jgi:hypothetical protein